MCNFTNQLNFHFKNENMALIFETSYRFRALQNGYFLFLSLNYSCQIPEKAIA
jgi:hypothetical protein